MRKGFWRLVAALLALACGLGFGFFAGIELVRAGPYGADTSPRDSMSRSDEHIGKPAATMPASLDAHVM